MKENVKTDGQVLFEKLRKEVENSYGADILGSSLEDFSSNELETLKNYLSKNFTAPFFMHNKQVSKTKLVYYIDRHLAIKEFRSHCIIYRDDYVKAFETMAKSQLELLSVWIDEKVNRLTLAYKNACDNFSVKRMENIGPVLASYEKAKEALDSVLKD